MRKAITYLSKFSLVQLAPRNYFCLAAKQTTSYGPILESLKQLESKDLYSASIKKQAQVLCEQLQPYFNQLNATDLKTTVDILNNFNALDITASNNLFHRGYLLSRDKVLSPEFYADLIDQLTQPNQEVSKYQIEGSYYFVKSVFNDDISPKLLAMITKIYGKLAYIYELKEAKFEKELIYSIKQKIEEFSIKDLGNLAIGLVFAQIKDRSVYNYIEQRISKIDAKADISDLNEIAQAFITMEVGSENFWRNYYLVYQQNMNSLSPADIAQGILTLSKHKALFDKQIKFLFEQSFLSRYKEFHPSDALIVFSTFAQQSDGSIDLWKQFEQEFKIIQENCTLEANVMLIYNLLNVLPKLSEKSIRLMQSYVISQNRQMDDELKDFLWEKMNKLGFLSQELDTALEKSKYKK